MPPFARRPFSPRTNDENQQAEARTASKGPARRPCTPRAATDENVPAADRGGSRAKTSPRMTRPRSAPLLEKLPQEARAPAEEEEESVSPEVVADAVRSVAEALSKGTVEFVPTFEHLLADPETMHALLKKKLGTKPHDLKGNEAKLKEYVRQLRVAFKQQLDRNKALLASAAAIQGELAAYVRTKSEEVVAQREQHEAAAAEWALQTKQAESEFLQKLDTAELIRQEVVGAAQRKEAEMAQTIHNYQRELAQVNGKLEGSRQELAATRETLSATRAQLEAKSEQLATVAQEKNAIEIDFSTYKEHHNTSSEAAVQAIAALQIQVSGLSTQVQVNKEEIAVKDTGITQHQSEISALKQRLQDEERKRRDMHNLLQELKGNIRVFCRVRPPVGEAPVVQVSEAASSVRVHHGGENYDFSYDTLFGTGSTQADVFEEVSGLVQSALDGYKVCIFAYGQTGSGKTYTMQGGRAPSSWGLIPRALSQILESAEAMRARGWKWTLEASFLEVYNEAIYDLLHKDDNGQPPVHTIIHDDEWGLLVTNVTSVEVDSMQQITSLMSVAAKKRSVGNTDMNATSSRSHAVFALYLKGENAEIGTQLCGALHLVDLAGSERLDKSGATGCRLKETQNINKSLSSLADVFIAKAEGRSHVPFRNSKLTYLMEPCLSGQGKTLMMVNVGPEESHSHETLCSLRFAKQVSQCHTGKPKRVAKMVADGASAPSSRAPTPSRAADSSARGSRAPTPPSRP